MAVQVVGLGLEAVAFIATEVETAAAGTASQTGQEVLQGGSGEVLASSHLECACMCSALVARWLGPLACVLKRQGIRAGAPSL